jgi:cation transport ATPase
VEQLIKTGTLEIKVIKNRKRINFMAQIIEAVEEAQSI